MIRAARLTGASEVVAVAPLDHARMHAAAHAQRKTAGVTGRRRAQSGTRRSPRPRRADRRTPHARHRRWIFTTSATMAATARAESRRGGASAVLHALRLLFPEPAAALDVGEEEGRDGGLVDHGGHPTSSILEELWEAHAPSISGCGVPRQPEPRFALTRRKDEERVAGIPPLQLEPANAALACRGHRPSSHHRDEMRPVRGGSMQVAVETLGVDFDCLGRIRRETLGQRDIWNNSRMKW